MLASIKTTVGYTMNSLGPLSLSLCEAAACLETQGKRNLISKLPDAATVAVSLSLSLSLLLALPRALQIGKAFEPSPATEPSVM